MFACHHYIHPNGKKKSTDMLSNYTSCLLVSGDLCTNVIFSSSQPKDCSLFDWYSHKSCTDKMLKKNLDRAPRFHIRGDPVAYS